MKILNIVKCEFIKNYTLKKIISTLIFLLLCVIVVAEYLRMNGPESSFTYENKQEIEELYKEAKEEEEKNPSLENAYETYYWKNFLERLEKSELLEKEEHWKRDCYSYVKDLNEDLFIINQMIENPDYPFSEIEVKDNYKRIRYKNVIEKLKKENKNLEELKESTINEIEIYQKLFEEGEYYKYIQFLLDNRRYEEGFTQRGVGYDSNGNLIIQEDVYKAAYEEIISQKLTSSNDYRVKNIFMRMYLHIDKPLTREEFFRSPYMDMNYLNYERYLISENELLKVYEEDKAILDYSIRYQKKQDIFFYGDIGTYDTDNYMTSKLMTNQVLYLGIIVLFLVCITSCGVISSEHLAKTDKMLLTAPITRTKILLGKFLYLVLHTYIIWLTAFILIFIYSGIRLGFHDLITPKLIYFNGTVHEINYILYVIVQIFLAGIPLLAIVSILLLISTASFSSLITVVSSLLLSFYSIFIGAFVSTLYSTFGRGLWMKFMEYTPFMYANQKFMLRYGNDYLRIIGIIDISLVKGIMTSMITIVLSLFLASIIYKRRDIKN